MEQIRVLRLMHDGRDLEPFFRTELWQEREMGTSRWLGLRSGTARKEWVLVDSRVPRRLGKPLPLIPFVLHGPRHARPDIERGPLENILAVSSRSSRHQSQSPQSHSPSRRSSSLPGFGRVFYVHLRLRIFADSVRAWQDFACTRPRREAMESFWSTLMLELTHRTHFKTRTQASLAIFDYIETFYNRKRIHSTLNYRSPIGFESQKQ